MKVFAIIAVLGLASALPQQLHEETSEKIESNLAKIVSKLPQNMKDEILRSSVDNSSIKYINVIDNTTDVSEPSYIIGDKNTRRYKITIKKKTRKGGRGDRKYVTSNEEATLGLKDKDKNITDENQFVIENTYRDSTYKHAEENKFEKDIKDDKEIKNSYEYSTGSAAGFSETNYDDAEQTSTEKNITTEKSQKGVQNICKTLHITSQDVWNFANKYLGLDISKPEDLHELERLYKRFVRSVKDDPENSNNISSFKVFLENSLNEDSNQDDYIKQQNYPRSNYKFWKTWVKMLSNYFTHKNSIASDTLSNSHDTNDDLGNLMRANLANDVSDESETVRVHDLDEIASAKPNLNLEPESELSEIDYDMNRELLEHEVDKNSNLEPAKSNIRPDTNAKVEESINENEEKALPEEIAEQKTTITIGPANKGSNKNIDIEGKSENDPSTSNIIEEELSKDESKKYSAAGNSIIGNDSKLPSESISDNLNLEAIGDNIPELKLLNNIENEHASPLPNDSLIKLISADKVNNILRDQNHKPYSVDESSIRNTAKVKELDENDESKKSMKIHELDNILPQQINNNVAENKYYLLIPTLILKDRNNDRKASHEDTVDLLSNPQGMYNIEKDKLSRTSQGKLDNTTEAPRNETERLFDIPKPNMVQLFLNLTGGILSDALKRVELYLFQNGTTPTASIKPIISRIHSEMSMLTQLSYDTKKCLSDNLDTFINMLKYRIIKHLKLQS